MLYIGDDLWCRSPTWSSHYSIPLIRLMGSPNEHQDLLLDQAMMASHHILLRGIITLEFYFGILLETT